MAARVLVLLLLFYMCIICIRTNLKIVNKELYYLMIGSTLYEFPSKDWIFALDTEYPPMCA